MLHPSCSTPHAPPLMPHPSPFTLHPSPFTLHPSPFTLHPSPFTLHPSPFTLHPSPSPITHHHHLSPSPVPELSNIRLHQIAICLHPLPALRGVFLRHHHLEDVDRHIQA